MFASYLLAGIHFKYCLIVAIIFCCSFYFNEQHYTITCIKLSLIKMMQWPKCTYKTKPIGIKNHCIRNLKETDISDLQYWPILSPANWWQPKCPYPMLNCLTGVLCNSAYFFCLYVKVSLYLSNIIHSSF